MRIKRGGVTRPTLSDLRGPGWTVPAATRAGHLIYPLVPAGTPDAADL